MNYRVLAVIVFLTALLACVTSVALAGDYYISPGNLNVRPGVQHQFQAFQENASGNSVAVTDGVTWDTDPRAGTITASGLFTAADTVGIFTTGVKARFADGSSAVSIIKIVDLPPQGGYVFTKSWGGGAIDQFNNITAISVAPDGNIYICDGTNHRVMVCDQAGEFIRTWGSLGTGEGEFDESYGIALDSRGDVYVADSYRGDRIQKFSSQGEFLREWGSSGSAPGQMHSPGSIAIDESDCVYVADCRNYRIQKYDSSGALTTMWGSQGAGEGQFEDITGIAVSAEGSVFVSDGTNDRVQKFDSSGNYVSQWGSHGAGNGQLDHPSDVKIGPDGNVYVADTVNDRVQVFDQSGTYLSGWTLNNAWKLAMGSNRIYALTSSSWVSGGNRFYVYDLTGNLISEVKSNDGRVGRFGGIRSVAVNANGELCVGDSSLDRIQSFGVTGQFVSSWPFQNPYDLACGSDGSVFAIGDSGCIKKYDFFGNQLALSGWLPSIDGYLAVGSDGTVYSSDGDYVLKWDANLNLLDDVYLAAVEDLTVTPSGDLVVLAQHKQWRFDSDLNAVGSATDSYYRLMVSGSDGRTYGLYGLAAYPSCEIKSPSGDVISQWMIDADVSTPNFAVDNDGSIYVADSGASSVDVYDIYHTDEPLQITIDYPTTENEYLCISPYLGTVRVGGRVSKQACMISYTDTYGSGEFSVGESWETLADPGLTGPNKITFTVRDLEGNTASDSITLLWVPATSDNLKVLPSKLAATPGVQQQFQVVGKVYSQPQEIRLPRDRFTWTVDPAVGSITPDGLLSVRSDSGKCSGTVKATVATFAVSSAVSVQPPAVSGGYAFEKGTNYLNTGPVSLAIDNAGSLFACYPSNMCIAKYSPDGIQMTKWGSQGSGDGQFITPGGIAADAQGDVYVADCGNNRIQVFDNAGRFKSKWGTYGSENGLLNRPTDVAVDPQNNVYVVDSLNKRIQCFDTSGNYLLGWNKTGNGDELFSGLGPVALNGSSEVCVGAGTGRIWKYDSSGALITFWGSPGTGDGQFQTIRGLGSDDAGNVYVAEFSRTLPRIQKFDSSGRFITKWGTYGSAGGQFYIPTDVAVDKQGNVYVADTGNYHIQKFVPAYSSPYQLGDLADGESVALNGMVVSAGSSELGDCFYLEAPDRSSGIKVVGATAERGQSVFARGTMTTISGERVIEAAYSIPIGASSVAPLAMNYAALTSEYGIDPTGLLVRTWGRRDFYDQFGHSMDITDGYNRKITCILPESVEFDQSWDYLSVAGIASWMPVGDTLRRVVRVRDINDITAF